MRQPGSSSSRRYADYGHMPHTTASSNARGNHTPSGSSHRHTPDVVVENSSDHSTGYRNNYHTAMNSVHSSDIGGSDSPGGKGQASNPNRSDIPPGTRRKGSHDPVCIHVHIKLHCL